MRQQIADDPKLVHLLNAVAVGDRVALAAIYDLLAPRVLAAVRSMLEEGDEDAVSRVVVDAFGQVWRQAPHMIEKCPHVAAWVIAMAVQRAKQDQSRLPERI